MAFQFKVFALLLGFIITNSTLLVLTMCDLNPHGVASIVSMTVIGSGMLMYRLTRGSRTRVIKYIHMVIMASGLFILYYGFFLIDKEKEKTYKNIHPIPGYVLLGGLTAQFLIAIVVMVIAFADGVRRVFFAPFHDIFGFWLFIGLAACALTTHWHMANHREKTTGAYVLFTGCFVGVVLVIFGMLAPMLNWFLVGRI